MSTTPPNPEDPFEGEDNPIPPRGSSKFYNIQIKISRLFGIFLLVLAFLFYSPENSTLSGFLLLLASVNFFQVAYYSFFRNAAEKKENSHLSENSGK